MEKMIICTLCPNGCQIKAVYTDKKDINITGNLCDRGYGYAVNECFDPRRTFTGSVAIEGNFRRRIPVRSTGPIPKDMMIICAERLSEIKLEAPVDAGFRVMENVFDSGADIVTTMSIRRDK